MEESNKYIASGLHKAASEGQFDMFEGNQQLEILLTPSKNTILHIYLISRGKNRSRDFIKKVLDLCPLLLLQSNNNGDTPLHIAARYGHYDEAGALIQWAKSHGVDNDLESRGAERTERLRFMLRKENKQKDTALHEAAQSFCPKGVDIVKQILENEGADYMYSANAKGEPPLYLAIRNVRYATGVKIVSEILKKCKSIDYSGPNGRTALPAAVMYKHHCADKSLLDILSEAQDKLIEKSGSCLRKADENGWTPLHYAAYLGHKEMVKKLLVADKAIAYIVDKDSRTALHLAACRGHKKITKMIISECVGVCELVDKKNWNVLHYAVISGRNGVLKVILDRPSGPSLSYLLDGKDEKGCTPIRLLYVSRPQIPYSLHSILQFNLSEESMYWRMVEDSTSEKKNQYLAWMKDLGNGPFGKICIIEDLEERDKAMKEKVIPELEKAKESHLVAAALVATVTFAAAFTLPGGYISDGKEAGIPILSRIAAFKAFVISNAIAMVLSTSSVFIHFMMVLIGYKYRFYWLIASSFWFIVGAMVAMAIAFVTGSYAVLAHSFDLAIAICIIGLSFIIFAFITVIKLRPGENVVNVSIRNDGLPENNTPLDFISKLLSIPWDLLSIPLYILLVIIIVVLFLPLYYIVYMLWKVPSLLFGFFLDIFRRRSSEHQVQNLEG